MTKSGKNYFQLRSRVVHRWEMVEKQYRIPTIDEFVDGFTYEVQSDGYSDDGVEDYWGWYKYTVGIDCWRDTEDIERELEAGNIRCVL